MIWIQLIPKVLLSVLFLFLSIAAEAVDEKLEWSLIESTKKVKWASTIYRSFPYNKTQVIYFFHGTGGDEMTWLNSYQSLRKEWRKTNSPFPIVAAVSFGPKWLLVKKNELKKSGLKDVFWEEIFPAVEANLTDKVKKRYLIGHSMGGYNALQISLDQPALFGKVVLISPVILTVSPYASEKAIVEYVTRTKTATYKEKIKSIFYGKNILTRKIDKILSTMRDYFPNEKAWSAQSPLKGRKKEFNRSLPHFYISCGKDDSYGLVEGAIKIKKIAKDNNVFLQLHILQGGHLVRDDQGIVEFLSK